MLSLSHTVRALNTCLNFVYYVHIQKKISFHFTNLFPFTFSRL